jgi:hypothetical protein
VGNYRLEVVAISGGFGDGFLKKLTGNWQLSPIITASSGLPLTLTMEPMFL